MRVVRDGTWTSDALQALKRLTDEARHAENSTCPVHTHTDLKLLARLQGRGGTRSVIFYEKHKAMVRREGGVHLVDKDWYHVRAVCAVVPVSSFKK